MRIVTDVHSDEARQLLAAPVFTFDIETDTNTYHWPKNTKRGLSYCADMTEIGFYCGEDWVLILSPQQKEIEYAVETTNEVVKMNVFFFSPEEEEFIIAMFSRDDAVTAIAHNLVFDARQVFGKFKLPVKDNYTFWDTRTVHKLRDAWRPEGLEESETDDDEDGEDIDPTAGDLLSLYEMYVEKLEEGYKHFVSFMKGQRKNFPLIDFRQVPDDVIAYMEGKEDLAPHVATIQQWRMFYSYRSSTKAEMIAFLERQGVEVPKKITAEELKNHFTSELMPSLDTVIEAMMAHYVTFDVIAPWHIYAAQQPYPTDYPKYPKLLPIDLEYTKFCIEAAARGMRVDRPYAIAKLKQVNDEYLKQLEALGFGADDWDRVLKRDFIIQYMFWGNRFDAQYKDGKNYAKNVKAAIAAAEEAGETPDNAYPSAEVLEAYQFTLLTKNGQIKFKHKDQTALLQAAMVAVKAAAPGSSVEIPRFSEKNTWLETISREDAIYYLTNALMKYPPITAADFSLGAKAMKDWLTIYPDMAELKNIGRLSKLRGSATFLEMILRESECDGRAHTLLGRFASTGRNTSSAPNLQNIHFGADDPITDMSGIFIADSSSSVVIELDYSNAENYSAAMISGDNNMAYACCAEDFHTARARFFFGADVMDGLSPDEKKKKRSQAKTVGFGEGYGMGAKKLAVTLKMTVDEARHLLDLSAQAFPFLAEAKDKARAFADANGYIPTWTGRRIGIPVRWWNGEKQFSSYTNGWNSPNQGGVAEIVVRAINAIRSWLRQNGYKSYVLGQVHDSLLINLELDEYPFVPQKIIQIMGAVLDGEVRYKATETEPAVCWNDSTYPSTRWLVDLDNIGNAKKWGYQAEREYPLPIDEYINTWGVHKLTEAEYKSGKAPTWINAFGYGEEALKKELAGEVGVTLDLPDSKPKREAFQWLKLKHAVEQVLPLLSPISFNGHLLDFAGAMALRQLQYERGENNDFLVAQEQLQNLMLTMEEYKKWVTIP